MAKDRPNGPQAVTANDLRSGAVVFLTSRGDWSQDVRDAELASDPTMADRLLARAKADHDASIVVEPVLIEISTQGDSRSPLRLRERIRASGPTVAYGSNSTI
jgi:hypothetical protein